MKTMNKNITLIVAVFLLAGMASSSSFAGKPGGGGKGGKVSVEAANPNTAIQGEEKDIYITGSGFGHGANVKYLVTGTTDDTQIEVLSTEFVESTGQLKTRVKVKDAAAVIDYDIEVQAASGRKGKGTTLFKVQQAEVACTGLESKAPTIVYMTKTELIDSIYSSDIYLSSASGCNRYLLLEGASQYYAIDGVRQDITTVDSLRFSSNGALGVVTWHDTSSGSYIQMGITFEIDSAGVPNLYFIEPQQLHYSPLAYDVVDADIHVSTIGERFLVMVEDGENAADRFISVLNLDTNNYQVISAGDCHVTFAGNCFKARRSGSIRWSPDGTTIYQTMVHVSESGESIDVITAINSTFGVWGTPEVITYETDLGGDLAMGSVSASGLLNFSYLQFIKNKRGKITGQRRAYAVVDIQSCTILPCGLELGIELPIENWTLVWTASESMISVDRETHQLVEFPDPLTGARGALVIENVANVLDSSL